MVFTFFPLEIKLIYLLESYNLHKGKASSSQLSSLEHATMYEVDCRLGKVSI
jgi:hypothetical protein